MGMPYSKQVHAAFDQVTPLVAAGFEVLRTTKNIAVFLAFLQVFVAIILTLTLLAILAVIYSVNPDLEQERRALVTPCMQWIASWFSAPLAWGYFSGKGLLRMLFRRLKARTTLLKTLSELNEDIWFARI
ncbi:hypothetical protein FOBRF1_000125 [Fusarium oxysporum]